MLRTTIETVALFVGTSSSIGVASLGLAATKPGIINDSTLLPLSLFVGGIALSAAFTWRAASAKAEWKHRLDSIEQRLNKLEDKP